MCAMKVHSQGIRCGSTNERKIHTTYIIMQSTNFMKKLGTQSHDQHHKQASLKVGTRRTIIMKCSQVTVCTSITAHKPGIRPDDQTSARGSAAAPCGIQRPVSRHRRYSPSGPPCIKRPLGSSLGWFSRDGSDESTFEVLSPPTCEDDAGNTGARKLRTMSGSLVQYTPYTDVSTGTHEPHGPALFAL